MAARCSGHKSQLSVSLMDSNITIQEKMKICLRPRYRPRKVNNKGAILVLIWNFLAMSLYHLIISYDYTTDGRLWQLVIGIILPLAGWLADTYTGRYKMIGCSLWIMWLATMFACVSSIVAQLVDAFYDINPKVITCLLLVGTVGIGGFQANIIYSLVLINSTMPPQKKLSHLLSGTYGQYLVVVWSIPSYFHA